MGLAGPQSIDLLLELKTVFAWLAWKPDDQNVSFWNPWVVVTFLGLAAAGFGLGAALGLGAGLGSLKKINYLFD